MRVAILITLALTIGAAGTTGAQKAALPDFSGIWVLNLAQSDFGGQPVPRGDTSKIVRAGDAYQVDQVGDFGPQRGGVQRLSYKWPASDGEATSQLQQGATLHVAVKDKGDTATFTAEFSVQGQIILHQTGREYLTDGGKVLHRETDLQQMQGDNQEPVHITLVYDKR
jgi:hypothetical protein